MPRPAPPLTLPRGLIFAASLWLIGSWLLTIGVRTPIQPVSASYTPAVRMMLLSMIIGLMIGWPLLRLSQGPSPHPVGQTVLDLLVLLALTQVVVWPLRLVTPWSVERTAAIDATISAWVVLAAAVVTAALASAGRGARSLAMAACLAMCILGPVLGWLGPAGGLDTSWLIGLSPLLGVHALGAGGGAPMASDQWLTIGMLGAAALAAWLVLAIVLGIRRATGRDLAVLS